MDVTYLKIDSRWCYLYRGIDKNGKFIDLYLSDTCDEKAAKNAKIT
jgi:putative transposase